jgi:hypothetical protein
MGFRGPAPKPSGVRIFEGLRAHRPLPPNEPQYPVGVPLKPRTMSHAAEPTWDELVSAMEPAGVLRTTDARALAHLAEDETLLSEAYAGLRLMVSALEERAQRDGKELPGGPLLGLLGLTNGRLVLSAIRDLSSRVIIERREFGLTPASRTRVSGFSDGSIDELERKLCG